MLWPAVLFLETQAPISKGKPTVYPVEICNPIADVAFNEVYAMVQ